MKKRLKNAAIKLPHIGMRKLKSIFAVFVGFWLWQLIRIFVPALEVHPIFIYIYGIIEMRETSEQTADFGKRRIIATIVGIVIGLPMMLLSEYCKHLTEITWLQVAIELAAILLGALITLCVADVVGCKTFCGMAASVLIILIISHSDGEPLSYSLLRSVQTAIGVLVAWFINAKLFPYHIETAEKTAE